jgi:hypothetical protein
VKLRFHHDGNPDLDGDADRGRHAHADGDADPDRDAEHHGDADDYRDVDRGLRPHSNHNTNANGQSSNATRLTTAPARVCARSIAPATRIGDVGSLAASHGQQALVVISVS